jgi:hypothetical protein
MRLSTEAFPIFDQERRSLIPAISVKLQRERVQTKQPTHQHRPAAIILNIGGLHDSVHQHTRSYRREYGASPRRGDQSILITTIRSEITS